MIELARHIEILLLENDCVIVPELGGFIAHYQPAHYEENEGVYVPPIRTVGFNSQLTMNDGLLVQAYMQTHHTDFLDASRKLSKTIEELKDTLFKEGIAEMPGIGTLHYNLYGTYEFHPLKNGILSPEIYALDVFTMAPLSMEVVEEVALPKEEPIVTLPRRKREFTLNPQWLSNAVAVAVAVILFFALSVPVENTYIDKGNYASLGTDCLFDAIRSQSMATTLNARIEDAPQKAKSAQVAPVAVKVEKVAQPAKVEEAPKAEVVQKAEEAPIVKETPKAQEAPKAVAKAETRPHATEAKRKEAVKETPKPEVKKEAAPKPAPATKKYHIIVASLTTSADAKNMLQEYKKQGHTGASIIESKNRFRISIGGFADKSAAYAKLNELKQAEAFKNAWMLTN